MDLSWVQCFSTLYPFWWLHVFIFVHTLSLQQTQELNFAFQNLFGRLFLYFSFVFLLNHFLLKKKQKKKKKRRRRRRKKKKKKENETIWAF